MNTKALRPLIANEFGFLLIFVVFLSGVVCAEVNLPAFISDNMVLQRSRPATIWGWADAGEEITTSVSWCEMSWTVKADENGRWQYKMTPPEAGGGPYNMTIAGENMLHIDNILVGEVWLCSGQSNMQMAVRSAENSSEEISDADYPAIRFFTVAKKVAEEPQRNCGGDWRPCGSNTVGSFSAAGYFFGRKIHSELGVAVGLIDSTWGGTPAESWMSEEALKSDSYFEPILERYREAVAKYPQVKADFERKLAEWKNDVNEAKAQRKEPPHKPQPPRCPLHYQSPMGLYNAMISPLMPFSIRGVVWYQGEANAGRAYQYRKLFPSLILSWREEWGLGDFPFYYVQIAPLRCHRGSFSYEPFTAAELREAQLMTMSSVPNTGMVVTTDITDLNDIHPRNKQEVGRRLALWALSKTYGNEDIVYSGPILKSMKRVKHAIFLPDEAREKVEILLRLNFEHTDGGLTSKGGPLTGFEVAGNNREYFSAKARIHGDTITVWSDKVDNPVEARFGWRNDGVPNLFNKAGLPASPFCTDDWQRVTAGRN